MTRLCPAFIAAALLLVSVTAGAEQLLTPEQARAAMFGSSAVFTPQPLALDKPLIKQISKRAGTRFGPDKLQVWQVAIPGSDPGWFMIDNVLGKHEDITYALGIDHAGTVRGLEILDYRETHGGKVREAAWRAQFLARSLKEPLTLGQDIDNVSGATLSCRHLTDGVRKLLTLHELYLKP